MKKLLLILSLTIWLFSFAFATVGGHSLISDIYYHEDSNVYRYAVQDHGWRWGAMLYEYNMDTNQKKLITKDNDNFYEDWFFEWDANNLKSILSEWWAKKLQELKLDTLPVDFELRLINFQKLDENFQTITTKVHEYDPDNLEYFMSWDIISYIRQNRIYVNWDLQRKTEITTCRLNKINYRWFSLPGENFVIVIASSNKSDCFEWWYIKEYIFPIKYINIPNDIFLNNYTEIVNHDIPYGQWPIMKQTTGGVFIELTQKDFQKGLNNDWTEDKDLENINKDKKDEKNIENQSRLQKILTNIKKRFQKIF